MSRCDAEDATQETFIRGLRQVRELRSTDAMGGWLRSIARNVCVDIIRRNTVRQTTANRVELLPDKSNAPDSTDQAQQLTALIAQLPEPLREVVLLHYFDQKTYDEMAEWLGVARSTVNDRLSRARNMLKNMMLSSRSVP